MPVDRDRLWFDGVAYIGAIGLSSLFAALLTHTRCAGDAVVPSPDVDGGQVSGWCRATDGIHVGHSAGGTALVLALYVLPTVLTAGAAVVSVRREDPRPLRIARVVGGAAALTTLVLVGFSHLTVFND